MLMNIVAVLGLAGFIFALACSIYAPLGIKVYFWWQGILEHEKEFWRQRANQRKGKKR